MIKVIAAHLIANIIAILANSINTISGNIPWEIIASWSGIPPNSSIHEKLIVKCFRCDGQESEVYEILLRDITSKPQNLWTQERANDKCSYQSILTNGKVSGSHRQTFIPKRWWRFEWYKASGHVPPINRDHHLHLRDNTTKRARSKICIIGIIYATIAGTSIICSNKQLICKLSTYTRALIR